MPGMSRKLIPVFDRVLVKWQNQCQKPKEVLSLQTSPKGHGIVIELLDLDEATVMEYIVENINTHLR